MSAYYNGPLFFSSYFPIIFLLFWCVLIFVFVCLRLTGSAKYVFADTPDCEVVHGALYACLRALFGLSVIGILVSLFYGMLVYQLLG